MSKNYFKLYANCIPVKGASRSGICDLQRNEFRTIPQGMYFIISSLRSSSCEDVIREYGKDNEEIIDGYLEWLYSNEYGFYCDIDEFASFPDLDLSWHSPSKVTNAIIDVNPMSNIDYKEVFRELIDLGVPHIQIRSYTHVEFSFYQDLAKICMGSRVNTIDILTPFEYDNQIALSDLVINGRRLLRINNIIIYNSHNERTLKSEDGITKIIYTKEKVSNQDCCGIISKSFFSVNLNMFTESQQFNTCLNRKISIDTDGNIKNCPSMQKSFGNIKEISLLQALNESGFKDVWAIKKDDIQICQDCEFRHICTDCRAFVDNPANKYSHPAKCSYNPYQAKWKGETGYISILEMSADEIARLKSASL